METRDCSGLRAELCYIARKSSRYYTVLWIKFEVYLASEICYRLQISHLYSSVNGSWGLC